MHTCSCRVKISQFSDIPKTQVTPAEAVILHHNLFGSANGQVISEIGEIQDITRADAQEKARLLQIYGRDKVEKLFPGMSPRLPQTFHELPRDLVSFARLDAPEPAPAPPDLPDEPRAEPAPPPPPKVRRTKATEPKE